MQIKSLFEAVTRKDVILYTIQGDADKVFELSSIRTTPAHLNIVYKEIAGKGELKKILAFHNHDALYLKIRVRRTMVQKPSAALFSLRTKEHFEAVTRKDVLPFQGDTDKVFELSSIRTTPAHLNIVYKEIAGKGELKKILAFHNHDALYLKIRVRRTMVQKPSAALFSLRTKEHFEAVTRKDVLPFQGDTDKVFELSSIRTTPAHLNIVYKEIAGKGELKKILAFHNHDALYLKIRVRRTKVQKDAAIVNDLRAEEKSNAANDHIRANQLLRAAGPVEVGSASVPAPAPAPSSQLPSQCRLLRWHANVIRQRDTQMKLRRRVNMCAEQREELRKRREKAAPCGKSKHDRCR
jgi:ubiquinone biosynthesis protein Coq4